MIILGIVAVLFITIMAIIAREIKHAPLVDEKEPFLWDDFGAKKENNVDDEVFHYTQTFCKHCKFFDGTAICLHENNFGEININLINYCKKNAIFEAK